MIRKRRIGCLKMRVAVPVSLLLVGFALVSAEETARLDFNAHRSGRVYLVVSEDCSFEPLKTSDGVIRLRWPGVEGQEFLGGGGIYVRSYDPASEKDIIIGPEDFEAVASPTIEKRYYEGCTGGIRAPMEGADDDGDGRIDEDIPDGIDNDGDGEIDEDFAAIGDEMLVASAMDEAFGSVISQESYAWGYGHMRDFVGLSTTLRPGKLCRLEDNPSCSLDAALVLDFDIGRPDDAARGDDDEFCIFTLPLGRGSEAQPVKTITLLAAKDGSRDSGFVGAIFFSFFGTGPGGEGFVSLLKGKSSPFMEEKARKASGEKRGSMEEHHTKGHRLTSIEELGVTDELHEIRSSLPLEREAIGRGDYEVVCELKGVGGDEVKIDWALVFGETEELLVRNALMAAATYLGMELADGTRLKWVAPARKARSLRVDMEPATFWLNGRRMPAAAISIPNELKYEDIEWLKLNGARTDSFEKADSKILVKLNEERISAGPVTVKAQLTDGTIISASCEASRLKISSEELGSDMYLPDDALQLFPNPFVSNLNISLSLYETSNDTGRYTRFDIAGEDVSIKIYDVRGRLVRAIYQGDSFQPGDYSFTWNGLDENGAEVAPGVYYCKLQIGQRTLTKRVILLR